MPSPRSSPSSPLPRCVPSPSRLYACLSCVAVFSPVPLSGSVLLTAAASLCSSASGEASRSSGSTHPARLLFLSSLHLSAAVAMGENSAAGKDAKGKAPAPTPTVVLDEAYLEAVTQKRIRMFEEIQTRQALERLNISDEPIKITLPDGAVKEGKKWISTPMDIAKGISSGLSASCLIAQVNGTLWNMARPPEGDCELKLFKFDSNEGRDTLWHLSAHILGGIS